VLNQESFHHLYAIEHHPFVLEQKGKHTDLRGASDDENAMNLLCYSQYFSGKMPSTMPVISTRLFLYADMIHMTIFTNLCVITAESCSKSDMIYKISCLTHEFDVSTIVEVICPGTLCGVILFGVYPWTVMEESELCWLFEV
jgi:hypothetical protein